MSVLALNSLLPIVLMTTFLEVFASFFYTGPGYLTFTESPTEACSRSFWYHALQIKTLKNHQYSLVCYCILIKVGEKKLI